MRRPAVVLIALLAPLLAASPAFAAQSFVGILSGGAMVRFQSDRPTALTLPSVLHGLLPRERIVALGSSSRRLYGIGSSARLYAIDAKRARAFRLGPPFERGLRGTRFSLAITPDGTQARLLSDVGQHLVIDPRTGLATPGAPLHRQADGKPVFPAADLDAQGRLAGLDLVRRELLTETAAGASVLVARPFEPERGTVLAEPAAFDIDENGDAWTLASFGGRNRDRQSILLPVDEEPRNGVAVYFRPFMRQIVTFASTGTVPDDETAPHAVAQVPRRLSVRQLMRRTLPVSVTATEGAQAIAVVRVGGENAGTGLSTADFPRLHRFRDFFTNSSGRALLATSVGRRATITIDVVDFAGNRTRVTRTVRLVR